MSLPKAIGMFRLTRDAELKYSQDGKPILKMGLAASEKFGDKETQCFLDAAVFGKQAEIISQYAGEKGTQIFISGKMQTESWEKDGVRHSKNSMIVESFDFVSKPKNTDNSSEQKPYTPPTPQYERKPMPENNLPSIDIDDEVIPF